MSNIPALPDMESVIWTTSKGKLLRQLPYFNPVLVMRDELFVLSDALDGMPGYDWEVSE